MTIPSLPSSPLPEASKGCGWSSTPPLSTSRTAYNSLQEYAPGAPGGEEPSRSDVYHLEVTDPEGMVVLGIGPDETPGSLSVHSTILGDLRPIEAPIVIRHLAKTAGDPPDHV